MNVTHARLDTRYKVYSRRNFTSSAVRLASAIVLMASVLFATAASAQETSTTSLVAPNTSVAPPAATSKTSSGSTLVNKQFEESQTLTDPKLKADAGSLSKLSAKASISYYGPTFGDLASPEQPNPDGSIGNYSQAMRGALSARYRLSSDSTISAGTGISFVKPFHGWDRTDINNPFLNYDFSSRFGKLQMRNSAGLTISTVPNYTAIGQLGGVSWDNSLVYGLGGGLALSFDSGVNYWIFSRSYRPGSTRRGGDGNASQYNLSWYPGLKYNVNDRFNINTSAGFSLQNPRSASDSTTLLNRTVSLRLGFGYAFTRDIYFAPYFQSFVTQLALNTTTINVSGVFSVL